MSTVPAGVQVGVQGTHLIRASINPSGRPQGRVLTQQQQNTVVTAASVTGPNQSLQVSQAGGIVQSPQITQQQQQQQQQSNPGGQILATVQCPRPQTATLVYSNVGGGHGQGQSPFGTGATGVGGQRLTLSHSRPIRPIQLTATNNRITGTGLRTANISIRPPSNVNVPGLTGTNVLTATLPGNVQGMNQGQQQQQQNQGMGQVQQNHQQRNTGGLIGTGGGVNLGNTGNSNLATRIIQVQAPQSIQGCGGGVGGGATAQVINTGRISGNLMTLTPVLSQVGGGGGTGNAITGRGGGLSGQQMTTGKVQQPSLTITHVGKLPQPGGVHNQQQQQQMSGQGQNQNQGHIVVSQAPQQPQTMIVTMGGQGGMVGGPMTTTATSIVGQQQQQQQHHQVMNVVSQATSINNNNNNAPVVSGTTTMIPLSGITTTVGRPPGVGQTGIVRTLTTTSSQVAGGGLQGNLMTSGTTATLMPLSKGGGQTIVETQLQQAQQAGSIFIHSRSPNPGECRMNYKLHLFFDM